MMSDPLKELQEELRILESMILRCPMNAEEDERVRLAMIRMDEVIREIERIEGVNPAGESKMDTLPEMPPLTPPSDDPPTRPGPGPHKNSATSALHLTCVYTTRMRYRSIRWL